MNERTPLDAPLADGTRHAPLRVTRTVAVQVDCPACGGDGWLPSLPEGQSACTAHGCKNGKITEHKPARLARIRTLPNPASRPEERVALSRYLPDNYKITGYGQDDDGSYWAVEGYDRFGWTLDDYVIPRLASGLVFAEEVTG